MSTMEMVSKYRVDVRPVADELGGGYEALFPQLARGVVGYGATPHEALEDLNAAVPAFLEAVAETGQTLPTPALVREWGEYSGKFNVRIPRLLHATLA